MKQISIEDAYRQLYAHTHAIREIYEQKGKKVIAVLGSFDTWSYMDYTCRVLAKLGHFAVTSLYCYFEKDREIVRRERSDPFRAILMRDSLRFMIFHEAHVAIIIYSVPGAHYIETEWCYERSGKDPDFKCYGITFVRKVTNERNCPHLNINVYGLECSECVSGRTRTAWDCIRERDFCPFKEQEVAKNVLEYFFVRQNMRLFALERLDILEELLRRLV